MRKSNRSVKLYKRLRLDSEVVRALGATELSQARGGMMDDTCDMGGTCGGVTTKHG